MRIMSRAVVMCRAGHVVVLAGATIVTGWSCHVVLGNVFEYLPLAAAASVEG